LIVNPFGVTGVTVMLGILVLEVTATVSELQQPLMVLQNCAVYVPGAFAQRTSGVPEVEPGVFGGENQVPIILVVVVETAVNVLQGPLQFKVWVIGFTLIDGALIF
jgi:hypothetical protein